MGFLDSLLQAERKIQKRIDKAFGKGAARTPLELRREILDEVETKIVAGRQGRAFPFNGILIRLQAKDDTMREIFRAAFLEDQSLEMDIRRLLREVRCQVPENLEIVLDFADASSAGFEGSPHDQLRAEFYQRDEQKPRSKRKHRPPDVEFVVLKGAAEQTTYRLIKTRIHFGRLKEILDNEGQVIRRNDLAFLDNGKEINSTVGRAHATVYFDEEKNEFRIVDEVSKYGTRIFRDGRSIEVPSGNQRGIKLLPSDEIHLGRACVRFNYPPQS